VSPALLKASLTLLVCLLLFLVVQRWLHREIQAVLLILTGRQDVVIGLFSLLFLPGVLLHEGSHYLAACLLGVKTGRFSVLPQRLPNGRLRLGYVETAQTNIIKDALIGAAPLFSGGAALIYLGIFRLGFLSLGQFVQAGEWQNLWRALPDLPRQPDFWLWAYLAFTISSTMLPSASDRRAWLPIGLALAVLFGLLAAVGAAHWMAAQLASGMPVMLSGLNLVFGTSLVLHIALGIPTWGLRLSLSRLLGVEVTTAA
jgi:hypothetical protein